MSAEIRTMKNRVVQAESPENGDRAVALSLVPNDQLDAIAVALRELGGNRLHLKDSVRAHNIGKPFRDLASDREQIRNDVMKSYIKEGETLKPGQEGYAELILKLNELAQFKHEIETPAEPLDLRPYLDEMALVQITLSQESLTTLLRYGLVVI
jgi:hypothetical protein